MKRHIVLLAALMLCLGGMAAGENAPDLERPMVQVAPEQDCAYRLLPDGTAQMTRYTGAAAQMAVPETLGGVRVSGIGKGAFMNTGVETVVIPEGVVSIAAQAFMGCEQLVSVTLPSTAVVYGANAFEGCTALREITLPEGVRRIPANFCSGCVSLRAVTIPAGVEKIGFDAFRGCEGLEMVSLPSTVKEVGYAAFANCAPALTFAVAPGSRAEVYCIRNGYRCEAAEGF